MEEEQGVAEEAEPDDDDGVACRAPLTAPCADWWLRSGRAPAVCARLGLEYEARKQVGKRVQAVCLQTLLAAVATPICKRIGARVLLSSMVSYSVGHEWRSACPRAIRASRTWSWEQMQRALM